MEPLGINFLPCSTAFPWSNGVAERAAQTIKNAIQKFLQQENIEDNWDEKLHYFTSAHNKSISVYGYAPEQLHFGFANPAFTDLIEIWRKVTSPQEYADKMFQEIVSIRSKAREKSSNWNKTNITYQNQKRLERSFFQDS
jgi:hypothetical protein